MVFLFRARIPHPAARYLLATVSTNQYLIPVDNPDGSGSLVAKINRRVLSAFDSDSLTMRDFLPNPIPVFKEEIPTPALIVDLDLFERNL